MPSLSAISPIGRMAAACAMSMSDLGLRCCSSPRATGDLLGCWLGQGLSGPGRGLQPIWPWKASPTPLDHGRLPCLADNRGRCRIAGSGAARQSRRSEYFRQCIRGSDMARPIVYGPAGSTHVWSARLALAEKGVAHELVDIGFGAHGEEPHLS